MVKIHSFYCKNVILSSGDANPSPNTYTLPSLLGPRIPNRPSSACYSMARRQKLGGFDTDYAKTPGPAVYAGMNPDNYQKKAPAFSMLGRQFMPGGRWTNTCLYMLWYQLNVGSTNVAL